MHDWCKVTELVSRLPDDGVVLLSLCQSSQFPVPVFLAADHLFDSGARMCSQCRHVFSVSTLVGTEADCLPSPLLSPVFVHGLAFRPWPCYTYHGPQFYHWLPCRPSPPPCPSHWPECQTTMLLSFSGPYKAVFICDPHTTLFPCVDSNNDIPLAGIWTFTLSHVGGHRLDHSVIIIFILSQCNVWPIVRHC